MPERLQKIIAAAGLCSRRKAEEFIVTGKVTLNGKVATIGDCAEASDKILVDGKPLGAPEKRYIVLNKPIGFETSLKSSGNLPTIFKLLRREHERLIPAGRLDADSRGLVLLTNDGELAHRVMHPSYPIDKVYEVTVRGKITDKERARLRSGIDLEEGRTSPCQIRVLKQLNATTAVLEFILHEGKKRQIRRMIAAVGGEVLDLVRVRIGPLQIGTLEEGQSRPLSQRETRMLKEELRLS